MVHGEMVKIIEQIIKGSKETFEFSYGGVEGQEKKKEKTYKFGDDFDAHSKIKFTIKMHEFKQESDRQSIFGDFEEVQYFHIIQ